MNYCENCFAAFDSPRCPLCGGRKVREIKEDDYCFLAEKSVLEGEMLADILRGNEIPCVTEPSGNGVRTAMALPLENRRLFVPWRCFCAAKSYLREIAEAETKKWRQYLSENADKLHLSAKLEKKIVKKSKGACGEICSTQTAAEAANVHVRPYGRRPRRQARRGKARRR